MNLPSTVQYIFHKLNVVNGVYNFSKLASFKPTEQ